MKIAFVVYQFPKLSETFVLNQITGLIDLGHEVDIIAHSPSNEEKVQPDVLKYDLLNKVFYYRDLTSKLSFLQNPTNPLSKIFFRFKLKSFLKKEKEKGNFTIDRLIGKKYDVVLCAFGNLSKRAILFRDSGLISCKKIGASFLGADLTKEIKKQGENCYKDVFKKADFFLPLSEFFKNRLIAFGCPPEKITIHHLGVDCDKFNLSPKNDSSQIQIITIGRLVEKKGIEYAIRAVAKLNNKSIKYVIIGDGPLKDSLVSLIDELDLKNIVSIIGPKDHSEVIDFFSKSDIFLLSSITASDGDMEGIPVSIMEAMSCRLPVVSTFHSGIPELVKNNVSGFLVDEKDVSSLAEKLDILINNSGLRNKMGSEGRDIIEKNFNIVKLNRDLTDKLKRVL